MTDLTPNDLSHLSDAEFQSLCPQGEHAPGPEPPTSQEIRKLWLDKFYFNVDVGFDDFKSVVLAALERWGK